MLSKDDPHTANMEFTASIIPYQADPSWVEPLLFEIKDFLTNQKSCPEHSQPRKHNPYSGCENGRYLSEAFAADFSTSSWGRSAPVKFGE